MKTISCKEAVNLILRKEEGKLSLMQRISLWRHMTICSLCKIFSIQNTFINGELKKHREKHVMLSDQEKERIIRNVLDSKHEE